MADHPHLTLVGPNDRDRDLDQEFLPLPFYPWDERPGSLPLDPDECATAIHLAQGDLPAAAELLKVPLHRLNRRISHHPRLARILAEANALVIARAASEYVRALDSPSDRRREWAAKNLLATRAAQAHPFSPAPSSISSSSASVTLASDGERRVVTFRWRTAEDDLIDTPQNVMDGDASETKD